MIPNSDVICVHTVRLHKYYPKCINTIQQIASYKLLRSQQSRIYLLSPTRSSCGTPTALQVFCDDAVVMQIAIPNCCPCLWRYSAVLRRRCCRGGQSPSSCRRPVAPRVRGSPGPPGLAPCLSPVTAEVQNRSARDGLLSKLGNTVSVCSAG